MEARGVDSMGNKKLRRSRGRGEGKKGYKKGFNEWRRVNVVDVSNKEDSWWADEGTN